MHKPARITAAGIAVSIRRMHRDSFALTAIKLKLSEEERDWTDNLVQNHGERWVIENWPRLERQLEYIRYDGKRSFKSGSL
jgi:hypothetical protein